MRFVIVTGMSGAGKSSVMKMLEDEGYFCADNLPMPFVSKFAELAFREQPSTFSKVAVGIDIRSGQAFEHIEQELSVIESYGCDYEILFLDASDEVLIKRFKENRRVHPLAGEGRVEKAIETERKLLASVKKRADYIIDTSMLLVRELKAQVDTIFVKNGVFGNFNITFLSFGFKYGIPSDADLVFDVRFMSNPYYVPELRKLTGNDKEVSSFVMNTEAAKVFSDKLEDMLHFLIPNYITEGKNQLVVAIGCTGGKHRSVTIVNEMMKRFENSDYGIRAEHRDIDKDAIKKG